MVCWLQFDPSLPFQLVKQCVGTVTLDQVKGQMNITCEEVSGPF